MANVCVGHGSIVFLVAVAVENLRGVWELTHNSGGAIFLLICHNLGCFCLHKYNMNCLSANALAASHDNTLAVSPPRSGLLLPFLVVTVIFTVMRISVHLPVLVPVEEAWIYGSITLSTFIGLHLPHEDLDDANSTVDDKIEDSTSSFLLSFSILMCLFTMSMMNVLLQVLGPNIVESNIYRFIALSTFIGLCSPKKDINLPTMAIFNLKQGLLKAKQPCPNSKVFSPMIHEEET